MHSKFTLFWYTTDTLPVGVERCTRHLQVFYRQLNEEEIAAEIRDIYKTSGFALNDFWTDLELAAERHE